MKRSGTTAMQLPLFSPPNAGPDKKKVAEILADPLVVWPGWQDSMPDWIRRAITEERLQRLAMDGDDDLATMAEVLAYLFCASLAVPLCHEWAEIYCNLAATYMEDRGAVIPDEKLRPRPFTDREETWLREIRSDIRCKQKREQQGRRRKRKQ